MLADDGPQQPQHLRHQCVQFHDGGRGNLFSDEIQNLRGHRGAARGCCANFFQLGTAGILCADAVQQYIAIPGDQGNEVGEIVGHAAGEPAQRLHLVCMAVFVRILRGVRVGVRQQHAFDRALAIGSRHQAHAHLAIRQPAGKFHAESVGLPGAYCPNPRAYSLGSRGVPAANSRHQAIVA